MTVAIINFIAARSLWVPVYWWRQGLLAISNKRNKQRVANKHYREIEGDVE